MRRASTLLAIVCTALAAGCGGKDEPSDEDAVRKVVGDYASAIGAGNGDRACKQMTEPGRRATVERVTAAFAQPIDIGCQEAVTELSNDLSGRTKRALLNPRVESVEVSGETASVRLRGVGGTTRLSRVDGGWRVVASDLGA
jgi:hypothetical protein